MNKNDTMMRSLEDAGMDERDLTILTTKIRIRIDSSISNKIEIRTRVR